MKQLKKHIIFLHLPKNGGSTIHSILHRFFKEKEIFTVRWLGEKGNLEDFSSMNSEQKKKIRLLKGHFDFGLHKEFTEDSEYFTFLRRPEDRIVSFYYYVKRSKVNRLHKIVEAGNMTFNDFIELGDKDSNNGQIRKLSGVNSSEEEMLEKTLINIKNYFPVVGIQEMFDESLVVLAYHFGWSLPFYKKKNVSQNKSKISEEDRKLLVNKNGGDIELYNAMKIRLGEQIKQIPNFKWRLWRLRVFNTFYKLT